MYHGVNICVADDLAILDQCVRVECNLVPRRAVVVPHGEIVNPEVLGISGALPTVKFTFYGILDVLRLALKHGGNFDDIGVFGYLVIDVVTFSLSYFRWGYYDVFVLHRCLQTR